MKARLSSRPRREAPSARNRARPTVGAAVKAGAPVPGPSVLGAPVPGAPVPGVPAAPEAAAGQSAVRIQGWLIQTPPTLSKPCTAGPAGPPAVQSAGVKRSLTVLASPLRLQRGAPVSSAPSGGTGVGP
ncbi:MAG: hypothetical protein EON86_13505 [Brevundimonas sp.]|nr:MAG: hypothetical protein EON86_13505 [Brevundimonas sp.]